MEEPRPAAAEGQQVRSLEITGSLDRHAVEALRLEVLRLARRHGVTIRRFRIAPARGADDR
jgi:hypothetical protein